jgi:hypothetical protein
MVVSSLAFHTNSKLWTFKVKAPDRKLLPTKAFTFRAKNFQGGPTFGGKILVRKVGHRDNVRCSASFWLKHVLGHIRSF